MKRANRALLALGIMLLSDAAVAREVSINWSERTKIAAPGGKFSLVTVPDFSRENNRTDIRLHRRGGRSFSHVAYFTRDIGVSWAPSGNAFALVDRFGEGSSRLRVFRIAYDGSTATAREYRSLDTKVRSEILERLPKRANIARYDQRVVSLNDHRIVTEVRGFFVKGPLGPGTGYCFNVESVLQRERFLLRTLRKCASVK